MCNRCSGFTKTDVERGHCSASALCSKRPETKFALFAFPFALLLNVSGAIVFARRERRSISACAFPIVRIVSLCTRRGWIKKTATFISSFFLLLDSLPVPSYGSSFTLFRYPFFVQGLNFLNEKKGIAFFFPSLPCFCSFDVESFRSCCRGDEALRVPNWGSTVRWTTVQKRMKINWIFVLKCSLSLSLAELQLNFFNNFWRVRPPPPPHPTLRCILLHPKHRWVGKRWCALDALCWKRAGVGHHSTIRQCAPYLAVMEKIRFLCHCKKKHTRK